MTSGSSAILISNAPVAQWIEQETSKLLAVGSIPTRGTKFEIMKKLSKKVETSAFSVLFATQAIWIMILGIVLLHETITIAQIAGTTLISADMGILAKNFRFVFKETAYYSTC